MRRSGRATRGDGRHMDSVNPAPDQRAARRRLRDALRWQRQAIDTGRYARVLPPRFESVMRELRAEAFAEVTRRDALGLSRPRRLVFQGVPFEVRCTSWGRLIVTDPHTRVSITTNYGVL